MYIHWYTFLHVIVAPYNKFAVRHIACYNINFKSDEKYFKHRNDFYKNKLCSSICILSSRL